MKTKAILLNSLLMNFKNFFSSSLAIAGMIGLFAGSIAHADTITASIGGAAAGSQHINFDNLALGAIGGTATGPNGSVNVSFVPGAKAVQGAANGLYAAPWLSGGNGTGFGVQPNGVDTTTYLTTGSTGSSVTLDFGPGASLNYLGLLWGSVDSYNTLSFYNGISLVSSFTGSQVLASPNGDQGVNGTLYVNINTTNAFNKVIATSTSYAFEFDNVAYRSVADASATAAMLGAAFLGLAALRRRFVA